MFVKIKQFGSRSDIFAYALKQTSVIIQHGKLEGILGKGYLGQPSLFPHEAHWPIVSMLSSKRFDNDEEAILEFINDCKGTGAHTKIIWEENDKTLEHVFEWDRLYNAHV